MTTMIRSRRQRAPRTVGVVRRSLLVALVAALVTLPLGLGSSASAVTPQADSEPSGPTGWIRVGHLSPGTPKAEVRLTPFSGGEMQVLTEAEFGDLSGYERVPVGLYTVSLAEADQPGAEAMLSRNVEIFEGGAATVVATGEDDRVRATVLQDDLTPPAAGQAKVRLISAATEPETIEATVVDGPVLARDLGIGAATGYAGVDAQTWDVELSAGDLTEVSQVPVEAGGIYTLVALDSPQGGLELRAVQDSGSSTDRDSGAMPRGGVDTGAGGTATSVGAGVGSTWAATGLIALILGALWQLRRKMVA